MTPTGLEFGARFRVVKSSVGTIPFDSGNVRSLELPRSFLYKAVTLRLSGTVTIVGTATAAGVERPLGLISKIELIADGRKVLFSIAGRDAYRLAHVYRAYAHEKIGPNAFTAATYPIQATIVLDNQAARMGRPMDSFFDPRPFEKVELRVTWSTAAQIATGGTSVTVDTTTLIDVIIEQTTEGADQILFNRLLLFDESLPTGATTNFIVNVPRSGLLAGILVRTDNATPATSDSIINTISLKSDNNFLHKDRLNWNTLKAFNGSEYQVIDPEATLPALGTGVWGKMPQGYAFVDLTEDGLITSALNTLDLNVLQLIYDVAAAGTIRSTFVYYEPIVTS